MIKNNDKSVELSSTIDPISSMVIEESSKESINLFVGQEIKVKPTGFKEYGVFCECIEIPGYVALLHISKISKDFVKDVSNYFTIGTIFNAKITEINEKEKKISLSTLDYDMKVKH